VVSFVTDRAHTDVIHTPGHQKHVGIGKNMNHVQRAAKPAANGRNVW